MDGQQKKSVEIPRGLFLVRYESAEDVANPPRVTVSLTPDHSEHIKVVLPPGTDESVLWSPGACLVVRAAQGGSVDITVTPAQANSSAAAKIQLVPISNNPTGASAVETFTETQQATVDVASLRVRGHVAGIGDVVVRPGEWIAGPAAPSRIEGLLLHWPNKPQAIDLRYAVFVGGPRPMQTPMVAAGTFAGTRGRALPLVGATLEITGQQAAKHQLEVEALFLGSPQVRMSGQRVMLSGPTGREPLVGLRVTLEEIGKKSAAVVEDARRQKKRVFRKNQDSVEAPAKAPIVRRAQGAKHAERAQAQGVRPAEERRKPVPPADKAALPAAKKQGGRVRVFQGEPKRTRPASET